MVSLLLSRGANINAFDKKDRRAIHWAAYMGMYIFLLINTNSNKISYVVVWHISRKNICIVSIEVTSVCQKNINSIVQFAL